MNSAACFYVTLHDIETFSKLIDALDHRYGTSESPDPATFYWIVYCTRMRLSTISRDKHVQISVDIPSSFFSSFQVTGHDCIRDCYNCTAFEISLSDLSAALRLVSNIHLSSKQSSFLCLTSQSDCLRMDLQGTKDLETLFEFKKLLISETCIPRITIISNELPLANWMFHSGFFQDVFQQLYQDVIANFSSLVEVDPSFSVSWDMTSEPSLEWVIQDSFGIRKLTIEHPTKTLLQSFSISTEKLKIPLGIDWFRFVSKTLKLIKDQSSNTSCNVQYYENGCLSFSLFLYLCKDPIFIQVLYASIQIDQNDANDDEYYSE